MPSKNAKLNLNKIEFVKSISSLSQLPKDNVKEIVFAGRSNAGKSSLINVITNKKIAKTSKSPGRTTCINFFKIDEGKFFVDLPGYGYAKVAQSIKKNWEKLLSGYLTTRSSIIGIFLIMDIRHPLKEFDYHLINLANYQKIPIHVVLSKSDKLKRNEANFTLIDVKNKLSNNEIAISVQLFSSLKKIGINEAQEKITSWFFI